MTKRYMVIVRVDGQDYLTKVEAATALRAEYTFLDHSIIGRRGASIESCQAFNAEELKAEHFIASALSAEPMSSRELIGIIKERNDEITKKDKAEEELEKLRGKQKEIDNEISRLEKIMAA